MKGNAWKKRKNEWVEEIKNIGMSALDAYFSSKYKILLNRELKNCIRGEFWGVWEGLYEFFKFNICCYNILKSKNIYINHKH